MRLMQQMDEAKQRMFNGSVEYMVNHGCIFERKEGGGGKILLDLVAGSAALRQRTINLSCKRFLLH